MIIKRLELSDGLDNTKTVRIYFLGILVYKNIIWNGSLKDLKKHSKWRLFNFNY